MRVSEKHIQRFKAYFSTLVPQAHTLYLFGSRTDDTKKGGDIDLLLVLESPEKVLELKTINAKIKIKLRDLADDQKVDVIFCTTEQVGSDAFLKTLDNKILL